MFAAELYDLEEYLHRVNETLERMLKHVDDPEVDSRVAKLKQHVGEAIEMCEMLRGYLGVPGGRSR
jgi:hypothetical protein